MFFVCLISFVAVTHHGQNQMLRPPVVSITGSGHIKNMIQLPGFLTTISTTNLAACVCVCAKCDKFLPAGFYFESKRPENFVRIAKFPYAAFGQLFAFHCPLFFTRNNDLERKSSRFAVIVRSSVADKQHGVIHSAGVAHCQEVSAKT